MISYLGDFAEDATVYIMFNTYTSNDPSASCTITNFANTDVHIHKDDGLAQRNNAAGITVSVDFDGITGSHMVKIDTSDNTVAGFWVVGHEYFVRIEGTTIDGATINSVVGQFSIENRHNEVDVVKWLGTAAAAPTVAGVPEVDITHLLGTAWLAPGVAGTPDVNTKLLGATVQTGNDVGADVNAILEDVTGINGDAMRGTDSAALASGVDLTSIHGAALTETVNGYLAAAFVKLFDVASPLLVASEVMRGTDSAYTGTPPTAAAIVNEWETQSQSDPTGFHVNIKEVNGTAQTANDNSADINSILTDTAEIGVAGAGLTDLGGMSTGMKAEVESEANDALIALNLDHLMKIATGGADMTSEVVDNSVLSRILANGDTSIFVPSTDGLQPIRDQGDSAWITATSTTVSDKTGFSLLSTGADLILKNSTFALAIADAIWDEVLSGATHNVASSAGRRVREIGAYAINSGTAQAGNATCITLAATASAIDGTYNRNLLVITDNTGVGQTRTIIDYDGSTKIATIDREWRTNPDATSTYQIVADDTPLVVDQGVAQSGSTSSTIKLRAYASSINDTYLCNIVIIVAGTGRGQARLVGAYNGTTKVVTLCGDNWITTPDDTSVYVMIPYGATCTSCVGDDALAQINTEVDSALNTAIPGSPTAHSINQRIKAIDELTEGSGSGDLAAILTDSTAIKAKTDNLPSGIAKNVALSNFEIYMVLSSDGRTAATGKTVTGKISKDGGTYTALTNSIVEISDGSYKINITQTEMNADVIRLKYTATGCDQRVYTVYTT